jgi:uncharacterized membrane protein
MNTPAHGIPIAESIRYGWDTFKKNLELILLIEFAAVVAVAIVNGASGIMERIGGFHEWAMWIANFVLSMIIHFGAVKIALKYRDGEKVEFANMFDGFAVLAPFIAASVLTDMAIGFGLMFLIVPGIIIAVRFCFFGFVLADAERGPIEAIQRSIRITEGRGLDLFLFGMLLIGLNVLGLMVLLIGVFVTLPVSVLAGAYIYRYLEPRAAEVSSTDHTCDESARSPEPPTSP